MIIVKQIYFAFLSRYGIGSMHNCAEYWLLGLEVKNGLERYKEDIQRTFTEKYL